MARGKPFTPGMAKMMVPTDFMARREYDSLVYGEDPLNPKWEYLVLWLLIKAWLHNINGYFLEWDDLAANKIARDTLYPREVIDAAIKAMIKAGLFSDRVYSEHKILTSRSIQEDFLLYKNRSGNYANRGDGLSRAIRTRPEIWLLSEEDTEDLYPAGGKRSSEQDEQTDEQPPPAPRKDAAPSDRDRLLKDFPDLPPDLIDRVITEAAGTPGVRNELQYASGILKDCKQKGIKTVPDFENDKRSHDSAKAARRNPALNYTRSNIPDDSFGPDFFVDLDKPPRFDTTNKALQYQHGGMNVSGLGKDFFEEPSDTSDQG